MIRRMDRDELLQKIRRARRKKWSELNLSIKDITDLPPEIGQLTNLRELNLAGTEVTDKLLEPLKHLANLCVLDLRCTLAQLPQLWHRIAILAVFFRGFSS